MFQGRVVDEAGQPIPRARVRAYPLRHQYSEHRSATDGTFTIPTTSAGPLRVLEFAAPGFVTLTVNLDEAPPPDTFRMAVGVPLLVLVGNTAGAPLPHVEVWVHDDNGSAFSFWSTSTAPEPEGVRPGTYTISAFAPGYQFERREVAVLGPTTVELRMQPAHGRTVRFQIRGADAAQLQQAECGVALEYTSTRPIHPMQAFRGKPNDRGVFELAGLPKDATIRLEVRIPGMRAYPATALVAPHARDGAFEIPFAMRQRPTRLVRCRVVDEAGNAVGPVTVIVYENHCGRRDCQTDPDGRFVIETTACDGELVRLWMGPGQRVFDSPTSLHYQRVGSRHLHVLEMPCDVEIELPTVPMPVADS